MIKWIKAAMAVMKAKREVSKMNDNKDKAGWKTSEFWLNILSIAITLLAGVQGLIPPTVMATIMGVLATVYTISRLVVKLTPSKADDALVDAIGEKLKDKLGITPVSVDKTEKA